MFDQIVSENTARTRRPLAVALSFAGQVLFVALAVLLPILRTEAIVPGRLLRIVAAPAGRGEPRRVRQEPSNVRVSGNSGLRVFVEPPFRQPARVPTGILPEEDGPASLVTGPVGPAIPGTLEGVPGGIDVSQVPKPAPPKPVPPPPPAPPVRLKVGGNVQAAKLLNQVMPVYPPLAKQARIAGTVRLEAVIGLSGMIQSLQVTSGHPLLTQAALDAVRQWVYRPTLLNGVPVEVLTQIEVNFKLGE